MFGFFKRREKIRIQRFINNHWIEFKTLEISKENWQQAVQEVYRLNRQCVLHRAVYVDGGLTHIYSNGFYTVST